MPRVSTPTPRLSNAGPIPVETAQLMSRRMTTSTVDPLLDIPGRSVAQNSCAQRATVVPPARRTLGLAPLYLIAVISFGALAATVGFSAADLPSPSTPTLAIDQISTTEPVAPVASETPVVLRGQLPLKAKPL